MGGLHREVRVEVGVLHSELRVGAGVCNNSSSKSTGPVNERNGRPAFRGESGCKGWRNEVLSPAKLTNASRGGRTA